MQKSFGGIFSMCYILMFHTNHYQGVYHLVHMGLSNYFSVQLFWTDILQI